MGGIHWRFIIVEKKGMEWNGTNFWPIAEKQNETISAIRGGPITEDDGYLTVQNPSGPQPLSSDYCIIDKNVTKL